LRKYLIVALAALASIALASVAIAQNSDVTSTTKVSKSKAGTKKKPKAIELNTFIKNNIPNTTVSTIEIDFPKTVKISGKGLAKCDIGKLSANGKRACPPKSKAGTGLTHARARAAGSDPADPGAPLDFNVTSYVGGKNSVIFYIEQRGGTLTRALPGKISKASGKYGQKLVISIPPNLQQTIPGLYGNLLDLKSTLYNKKGKNSLISTVGCKNKKHGFGAKFTFVPNPGPPPQPSASGTSTATCKK
jgi:hypothetical protein